MHTEEYTLPNGIRVLIRPQHKAPVVSIVVNVGVGSADETSAEAGLAHVHEHMLFKGTSRRGVGQIAQEIEACGGEINAFTSLDETNYYTTLSSRFFEQGMDILSDALWNSSFDPDELEKELQVIQEEIRREQDSPFQVLSEKMFGLAYQRHPYANPVIGTSESVDAFTREDILRFFQKWYSPEYMTLSIVGDVSLEKAKEAAEKYFGRVEGRPPRDQTRPPEPPQKAPRSGVYEGATQEIHLAMAFHTPEFGHEDGPALDLLRMLLSYGETSRLIERMDRELEWVNYISAGVFMPHDPGLLTVSSSFIPSPDHVGIYKLAEEIARTLVSFVHHPPAQAELDRARALLESSKIFQKQTVEGQAQSLAFLGASKIGLSYNKTYYEGLRRVTPEDISRVVRAYLKPENLTVAAYADPENFQGMTREELVQSTCKGLSLESSHIPGPRQERYLERDEEGIVRLAMEGGPTLIVQEDRSVELVSVRAAFLAGLRYENVHNAGLTGLLSALWSRSTSTRSYAELSHEVESLGSMLDSFGGRNTVGLQMDTPAARFSQASRLFADVLINPEFNPEELSREKRLIKEDLLAQQDSPGRVASLLQRRALYAPHPYAFDPMGTPESIDNTSRDDLMGFYRNFIQPDLMSVAVVGDISAEEVLESFPEKIFQGPFLGGTPSREQPPEAPQPAAPRARVWTIEAPRQQAHILLGFRAFSSLDPRRYSLDALSAVLSGQGGRLFLELRDKQSLAYSVYAYNFAGLDGGNFTFAIATSPDKIEQAVRGIVGEIQKLQQTPVSEAELQRVRPMMIGGHDIQLQRLGSRASMMSLHELYGMGYAHHRQYAETIQGITGKGLQSLSQSVLNLNEATLVVVRPEGSTLPDLSSLGFPAAEEVSL